MKDKVILYFAGCDLAVYMEASGAASVDGPSTSSKAGIIRDGDNVVLDANGYKSLITVKRGRCATGTCIRRFAGPSLAGPDKAH